MVTLNINLKEIRKCSSKVANICPEMPTPSPRPWGWGQNSTFSEHGHVAYQNKKNHECSNVVANILPADPPPPQPAPPTLWIGSVGKKSVFFSTWSCYLSN